jgi:hypothetical protein
MSHELKRECGGEGPMGWIRPTCSCGWRGIEYYAYNDYQHTEVGDQEQKHLRRATQEGGDK